MLLTWWAFSILGADPHVYEPVPADSVALEEADIVFYNGYNLEPNLVRLMESTGKRCSPGSCGRNY